MADKKQSKKTKWLGNKKPPSPAPKIKIPKLANTQQKKKRKAPWVESDVKRNDKGQFA